MEKIRKEEISQHMGINGSVSDDLERRQLVWYDHVQRMDLMKKRKEEDQRKAKQRVLRKCINRKE